MVLKIAFVVNINAIFFLTVGELFMSIEYLHRAVQILISLSIALAMFLASICYTVMTTMNTVPMSILTTVMRKIIRVNDRYGSV